MAVARKGPTLRLGTSSSPASEINITPLVDVVLVLLIIFMVMTPLVEKDIGLNLPEEDDSGGPAAPQLVVSIAADGALTLNQQPLSDEEYTEKLRRAVSARGPDDRLVFFLPNGKASYARVVAALDGAKLAGAKVLGMVTTDIPEASSTSSR